MKQSEKSPKERPAPRVAIENIRPRVNHGRFPIKRVVGDEVVVTADIHADGHDALSAALLYRPIGAKTWNETAMQALPNDLWQGQFKVESLVRYEYAIQAW